MKKKALLNQDISCVIAGMGHTDHLVISDAGLPIPDQVKRIDLALTKNCPLFTETLEAVCSELEVESVILAEEIKTNNPELHHYLLKFFTGKAFQYVSHEQFKQMTAESKAIIRTGEFSPYANIILVSGVVF